MRGRGGGRHHLGLAAEEAAARLYTGEGGEILAARWRCPEGEIDLVMGLPGLVVFVEVKARRRARDAAEAVSPRQWRRIGAAAARYLAEHTDGATPCRIDLVTVDAGGRTERIENVMPPGADW